MSSPSTDVTHASNALLLAGLLVVVSDTFDAIGDDLSVWNVLSIALGVFLVVSGLIELRRTTTH